MDAPTATVPVRINRWLPYWAVFQADVRQTLRGWVYLFWVFLSVAVTVGYLLYRRGVAQEAGLLQPASLLVGDLLRWTVMGSVTLIIVLTAGSISSERGTMADSVLSRGISRYQYFLGKWHARLLTVLATFLAHGTAALVASYFLLHEDLSLMGCTAALVTVAALLAVVVSCGVAVSAASNSTLVAIAVLWVVFYGAGFAMSFLPSRLPSPDRVLHQLPYMLQGHYNWEAVGRLVGWSTLVSLAWTLVGMVVFSRRDV